MNPHAVLKAASGAVTRRLVQTGVVMGVLTASTAAAVLGLALATSANQGFHNSFRATHGAELAVMINQTKVTDAQLAQTRNLTGVTKTAGPFPATTITVAASGGAAPGSAPAKSSGHGRLPPTTLMVVGRASPSGPLDRIAANPSIMNPLTHGHGLWPRRPGEISLAMTSGIRLPLGSTVTVTSAPGKPKLTIVGYGGQTEPYDGGWTRPGEIAALRAKGAPPQEEMFYNFKHAGTTTEINADLAELKAALPPGAIAGSQSWLPFEQGTNHAQSENTAFVEAFAVLALVLAVLTVANVVAAAVVASYRRIGILKSIGFTPAQVTFAYLAQLGAPAVAGAILGAVLGAHWAQPLISMAPIPTHVSVPRWIDITAPAAMLALAALAAAVPAARAGRLSAVGAITAGQAPRAHHGYLPHRVSARLPVPRPISIGLAAPFTRPARSAVTLAAITFGLTAVVLAAGLDASIHKINYSAINGLGQVQVSARGGRSATLTTAQSKRVTAALRADAATLHYVAESNVSPPRRVIAGALGSTHGPTGPGSRPPGQAATSPPTAASSIVGVTGMPNLSLSVTAYDGDSSWLDWAIIKGHWYRGPGEVDVTPSLLAATGRKVGDMLTLAINGKPVAVHIAGEIFTPVPTLPNIWTSYQTLGTAADRLVVSTYDIAVRPGTDVNAYVRTLGRTLGSDYEVFTPSGPSIAAQVKPSYFHLLELLVAILAALGVLNSVLMATRERVHELGVFKAIGMTPGQTLAMVLCWVVMPTIIAAAIALPAGMIVQDTLVHRLARIQTGSPVAASNIVLPASFVHVYTPAELALLAAAGLGIAVLGTLGPAGWAAFSRTTTALRAE